MNRTDDRKSLTDISDSRHSTAVIFDNAKIRVGALSPAFPPAKPSNTSKVRIGAVSPAFPIRGK